MNDGGCKFYQAALQSEILLKSLLTRFQRRQKTLSFLIVLNLQSISCASFHLFLAVYI